MDNLNNTSLNISFISCKYFLLIILLTHFDQSIMQTIPKTLIFRNVKLNIVKIYIIHIFLTSTEKV